MTKTNTYLITIIFSFFVFVFTAGCSGPNRQNENTQKPNLLLIITDDQGYGDFSIYGGAGDVSTPNMDQLAESFSHPACRNEYRIAQRD